MFMAKCGRKLALMCNNLSIMGPAQCQFHPQEAHGRGRELAPARAQGTHMQTLSKATSVDRVEE